MKLFYSGALLLSVALYSCQDNNEAHLFDFIPADQSGVVFSNRITDNDTFNIMAFEYVYNGGGVAIGDFNNDQKEDLFFTGNMVENQLYLNKGDFEFENISESAGIGSPDRWCSGVATVDINADGWLDLYVCATVYEPGRRRKNQLYINQGATADKKPVFKEMAEAYGLADTSHTTNAAFFDYDNDGDLDVYLLVNEMGDKRLPNTYRKKITDGSSPRTDKLYRCDWVNGQPQYTNVSHEAGITIEGYGLGLSICDINQDGWKDVYVTNDYLSNDLLWMNNGDGTFTDKAAQYLKYTAYSAMGHDAADLNNDGLTDILAVDMLPEDNFRRKTMLAPNNYTTYANNDHFGYQYQFVRNVLQLNQGQVPDGNDYAFSEISMLAGLPATDWSWSPLAADLDHDGLRDLLITNGFPKDITDRDFMDYQAVVGNIASIEQMLREIPSVKISNYAFRNTLAEQTPATAVPSYENITRQWGFDRPSFSNGAAFADLDNDGDLDYVVNNINDSAFIYRNNLTVQQPTSANWLKVQFKGNTPNLNGLGATVSIRYGDGQQQFYDHSPYRGYLSTVQSGAHFGLGAAKTIDELVVTWPGGTVQILKDVAANQTLTVEQGKAGAHPSPFVALPPTALFQPANAAYQLQFTHRDSNFVDFNIQRLLLHKFSQLGPGLAVADLNGDGLDDLYVGGSHFNEGTFFLQGSDQSFVATDLIDDPANDHSPEELGVLFFDADGDGDDDLYLVSGGSEFDMATEPWNAVYKDRLLLNVNGRFQPATDALPPIISSGSCVKAADYDHDGDLDLFVGGRVFPNRFPTPVSSYLLRNDSSGKDQPRFSRSPTPVLDSIGLISDALWTDVDNDGWADLLLAGELMPLTVIKNNKGQLAQAQPIAPDAVGLWNSLCAADFDNDGDMDYLAGNNGINTLFYTRKGAFLAYYAAYFDNSTNFGVIPSGYFPNKNGELEEFPYYQRTDMEKQVIKLKDIYAYHKNIGVAPMADLMSNFQQRSPKVYTANYFHSCYVENKGNGQFELHPLALEAQVAPVFGIIANDFNNDGNWDALLTGNDYGIEMGMGNQGAFNGLLLLGNGKGDFRPATMQESGICIPGDGKSLATLQGKDGTLLVAAGQNKGKLLLFTSSPQQRSIALQSTDFSAILHHADGRKTRLEFPYGSSYLSQSARRIWLPEGVKSLEIMDFQGKKREGK